LLDQIVQVFDLADFDGLAGFFLKCLKGCGVEATFADGDLLRKTLQSNRLLEKTQSSLLVATGGQFE